MNCYDRWCYCSTSSRWWSSWARSCRCRKRPNCSRRSSTACPRSRIRSSQRRAWTWSWPPLRVRSTRTRPPAASCWAPFADSCACISLSLRWPRRVPNRWVTWWTFIEPWVSPTTMIRFVQLSSLSAPFLAFFYAPNLSKLEFLVFQVNIFQFSGKIIVYILVVWSKLDKILVFGSTFWFLVFQVEIFQFSG